MRLKIIKFFSEQDSEQGRALCLSIADTLKLDSQHPSIVQWEKQLNESYSAREVTHLFSKTVLQSLIKKRKTDYENGSRIRCNCG